MKRIFQSVSEPFVYLNDAFVPLRALIGVGTSVLVLAFILVAVPAWAQHQVSGTVLDAEGGSELPGVNIVVVGETIGTTSRSDGSYAIEAPSPQDTLAFSFVGYMRQEVPIQGRSEIEVTLEPSTIALDEVVVNVGYQERAIETTTGSVSQISGEDLELESTTNLTQSLNGSIPGIVGVQSSGRPGQDDVDILVRGTATLGDNEPLVVVDGVPARQGGLARLNPADIESVSVLKDASAAIYGARAANGVILVTTKRGGSGATRVTLNVEQSYSQPTVVPEMANAPTYMQMLNEIDTYRGAEPRFTQEEIEAHRNIPAGSWDYFDTDWYGEALKDFSRQTVVSGAVAGGTPDLRYRISLRGLREDGILVNSGTQYNQIGFRSNLDGDVNENLTLTLDLHGRLEDRETPAWTRGLDAAWEMLQRGKPTDPAFWPNGLPGPAQEQGVNPVVASETGLDDSQDYYFQSNLSLDLDVPSVDGLSLEGTVAYDQRFMDRKRWQTPWVLYSWDGSRDESGDPVLTGNSVGVPDPRLNQWTETVQDVMLRGTGRYETRIGRSHDLNVLLGSEYQYSDGLDMEGFRRFFPTDQIDLLFAGGRTQQNVTGSGFHTARLNFYGRAAYDYQKKYLFEFINRYDGSYIFPEGQRFGYFPAVTAGWRLAREEWFTRATRGAFSRFKLRASYGQTGNDRVAPYQYLRTFGFNGQFAFGDGLGTRLSQTRVPNRDITWEVANQLDVGLDGAILDERLTFSIDYFREDRNDILWTRGEAVPLTAGFTLPEENLGRVNSWGWEGQLQYAQQVSDDFSLRLGANLSWAENEIEFFAEPPGAPTYQQATGSPMETSLYYIAEGIWRDQQEIDSNPSWPGARPGDVRFRDLNDDGVIDGLDRERIDENGLPDIIGGFNLAATYGRFDLTAQFQGALQARHYVFSGSVGEFGNFFGKFADRRWTADDPDAEGPRAYNRVDPYWASNASTFFLRDAKYLRLRNLRVSYSLPLGVAGAVGAGDVRLYVSARNLFTWSPLDIMDPEIRNGSAHSYPPERTFAGGIQFGF